jgi:hypothetical protein
MRQKKILVCKKTNVYCNSYSILLSGLVANWRRTQEIAILCAMQLTRLLETAIRVHTSYHLVLPGKYQASTLNKATTTSSHIPAVHNYPFNSKYCLGRRHFTFMISWMAFTTVRCTETWKKLRFSRSIHVTEAGIRSRLAWAIDNIVKR